MLCCTRFVSCPTRSASCCLVLRGVVLVLSLVLLGLPHAVSCCTRFVFCCVVLSRAVSCWYVCSFLDQIILKILFSVRLHQSLAHCLSTGDKYNNRNKRSNSQNEQEKYRQISKQKDMANKKVLLIKIRGHSFSAYAKFSEKLTFLTP